MNAVILLIIGIPAIEIYLMIKVGGVIGALNTILLIFFTAITGVYFAKIAGLSTLKSGFNQLLKNEIPVYEIISLIPSISVSAVPASMQGDNSDNE